MYSMDISKKKQILGIPEGLNEFIDISDTYFGKGINAMTIDHNANVDGISPNNYFSELVKPMAKKYFFHKLNEKGKEIYGNNFTLNHIYDGTIYIHDSTKLQPYCWGTSATDIATFGRPHSTLPANPPKRLESFMGQMTEYIMELSQQFAGAIAVTDLVPWMAWFIEKGKSREWTRKEIEDMGIDLDKVDYANIIPYTNKEIENIFQSFVHVLNNNFRVGGDSPFTNISVNSKSVYYDIFDMYVFPDGKTIDDLWQTIKRVQKIIVKFMYKGQSNGLPYRFPILTANFKAKYDEIKTDWFKYIARKNHKGFMNINFAERFAMCCRLNLDFDFKQNSFGGGGVKVGSMRVANINLPRLAYLAKRDRAKYIELLRKYIKESIKYITAYRDIFKELIDKGYLTFFKEPSKWFNINMFFGTIGFCGIWDAVEILFPHYSDVPKDVVFEKRVNFMDIIVSIFVNETKSASNGIKFNVEQVPSESAAGTMAKMNADFGEKKPYYSNQFIPLQEDVDLDDRIRWESKLQKSLTGGGMTFLNFDTELSELQSQEIHEKMMESGFEGQFCINYGFTKCGECGKVNHGIHATCKDCDSKNVKNITRVVGYFAEITNTAESKTNEIKNRLYYAS